MQAMQAARARGLGNLEGSACVFSMAAAVLGRKLSLPPTSDGWAVAVARPITSAAVLADSLAFRGGGSPCAKRVGLRSSSRREAVQMERAERNPAIPTNVVTTLGITFPEKQRAVVDRCYLRPHSSLLIFCASKKGPAHNVDGAVRRPVGSFSNQRAADDGRPSSRKSCFNASHSCYFGPRAAGPGESYSDVAAGGVARLRPQHCAASRMLTARRCCIGRLLCI